MSFEKKIKRNNKLFPIWTNVTKKEKEEREKSRKGRKRLEK